MARRRRDPGLLRRGLARAPARLLRRLPRRAGPRAAGPREGPAGQGEVRRAARLPGRGGVCRPPAPPSCSRSTGASRISRTGPARPAEGRANCESVDAGTPRGAEILLAAHDHTETPDWSPSANRAVWVTRYLDAFHNSFISSVSECTNPMRCPPEPVITSPRQYPPAIAPAEDSEARVPRTSLRRIFRQRDASGIPAVCEAVRNGRVPGALRAVPPCRGIRGRRPSYGGGRGLHRSRKGGT